MGSRASRPCLLHGEAQAVYSRRGLVFSPQGRMLAVSSCQKGTLWALWKLRLSGLERPTFWALVSQAVSRQRPKFWPGSVSDPMTYPKGGSWERPSNACPYPNLPHLLPTWKMDRLIVPRQKPGEALIIPRAKPSRNLGVLFLPPSKFSSAEVFGLSA